MKTAYFIRHGESESNTGGVRRGNATPLTERGKQQAGVIADRASRLSLDVVISSVMERAKDTAQAIAEKTGKPVEYSELFVERVWPSWFIGRLRDDSEAFAADEKMKNNFTIPNFRLADEENFDDLKERALAALDYLNNRKEQNMVVVTHGTFLRALLAAVIYGPELSAHEMDKFIGGFITENTGITVIKESPGWKSGWRLYVFNDHAHLAD